MRLCFFATAAHRAQSWAQLQLLLCLTLAKAGLIHHIDICFLGSTSQLLGLQRFPCAVFIRGVLLWIKHSSFCWLFCPRSLCHESALVWVSLHMWRIGLSMWGANFPAVGSLSSSWCTKAVLQSPSTTPTSWAWTCSVFLIISLGKILLAWSTRGQFRVLLTTTYEHSRRDPAKYTEWKRKSKRQFCWWPPFAS